MGAVDFSEWLCQLAPFPPPVWVNCTYKLKPPPKVVPYSLECACDYFAPLSYSMSASSLPDHFEHKVAVIIDGTVQAYWDRETTMSEPQRLAMARLQKRLHQGFEAGGVRYDHPDSLQCAQFAASMIPQALRSSDDGLLQTALSLVCTVLPELKQIEYRTRNDGDWDIAFITDRIYMPHERPITLVPEKS